ncbi:DUF3793 family protein [Candidatus Merdisoma sp. HCP28S3_D10]|uniref:DUF3793 family protein n=1 Tax=unclassified Candidatus Merdisoma TaxID=3099611 RepID=UPI003F8BA6A5
MAGVGKELERLLATHCAPVFCHKKAANLVAARRELLEALPEVLAGSRISWVQLCGCKKYCHILFYDRERLENYLIRKEHRKFLEEQGYGNKTLEEQLKQLAGRYESYQKQGSIFPHEIGLFLEYPLADIEGFIEHQGKDALESGYWKVYGDVEQARALFRLYDELKTALTTMLAAGVSFRKCCAAQGAA